MLITDVLPMKAMGMARTVRDAKLETRSARIKLKPQKEPHWRLISEGAHLGYYKGPRGGSWLARYRPKGGNYTKTTLGHADDVEDANGGTVLDFKQAQDKARVWFKELEAATNGGYALADLKAYTVADALAAYLKHCQQRGGKSTKDAEIRANALILPPLGDRPLFQLTTQQIRDWLADLAEKPARLRTLPGQQQRYREEEGSPDYVRRRRATANRTLTILKAALNYAFHEGKTQTDEAWRRVKPFREADAPKVHYLTLAECVRLVDACEHDFSLLVKAALLTGCRYGELVALVCGDFDPRAGTVHVRMSKSGKARHVVLNDDGARLFAEVVGERPVAERMFLKANGDVWGISHQQRPLVAACKKAGIVPPATFHILRHTYASHLVQAGAPLPVIAANLGHSDTRMTERHYAHLAPGYVADVIRASMPKMGF